MRVPLELRPGRAADVMLGGHTYVESLAVLVVANAEGLTVAELADVRGCWPATARAHLQGFERRGLARRVVAGGRGRGRAARWVVNTAALLRFLKAGEREVENRARYLHEDSQRAVGDVWVWLRRQRLKGREPTSDEMARHVDRKRREGSPDEIKRLRGVGRVLRLEHESREASEPLSERVSEAASLPAEVTV